MLRDILGHNGMEILRFIWPGIMACWMYFLICSFTALSHSTGRFFQGEGFHPIRNFKACFTFPFKLLKGSSPEPKSSKVSYRPACGVPDNLPDSYYQASAKAKKKRSSFQAYGPRWNPLQSLVDGLGDFFEWAIYGIVDLFDWLRFGGSSGSGNSGSSWSYQAPPSNGSMNYQTQNRVQTSSPVGSANLTSVPLQQITPVQIAPVYYKGVGSLVIAEDIFKNNRFRPSTGHRLHGAWISPQISKAIEYGQYIVELSVNAPQEYWCHINDIEAHPSYKALSQGRRPKGIDLSQIVYQLGYAVIYVNSKEVVIVSPQKGQLFTTPIVTIHRVIDPAGNVILS